MSRPSCGQPCTCTCISLCHLPFVVCLPIAPASINGQAKVRYCHNAVAMFSGVRGSTYRPYLQLCTDYRPRVIYNYSKTRCQWAHMRICPHIHILCMPACIRCLHVLAQARPMMTCIELVYVIYAIRKFRVAHIYTTCCDVLAYGIT